MGGIECWGCSENFKKRADYRDHVREHHARECSWCGRAYLDDDELVEHVKDKHPEVIP